MQYDVNFSARIHASAPNVSRYTCACLGPDGSTYLPATAANLAAAGGLIAGIFLDNTNAGPGALSSIQVSGIVLGAMAPGLVAPGATASVGPNELGVLSLISTTPTWTVDSFGNVHMTGGAIGIGGGPTFTVSTVGSIATGQVVASYGIAGAVQTVQLATSSVLQAVNAVVGIATSNGSTGNTITVAPLGSKVANSVTALGTGAIARCGIDPVTSRPVRLTLSTSGFEIGTCDATGAIALVASNALKQSPIEHYNPTRYGAVYSDTDPGSTQRIANTRAINKIRAEFRKRGVPGRIALVDSLWVQDTVWVDTPFSFEALGSGAGAGPAQLIFPGTDEGINVTVKGLGAHLSHFIVKSTATSSASPPLWQALHAYTRGTIIRCPSNNRYQFRATEDGTSGATIPASFVDPNATTPQRWSYGALYAVGDYVFPSRHETAAAGSQAYGRVAFRVDSSLGVTTAGTFGYVDDNAEPTWNLTPGGTTTSGDLVFTTVTLASLGLDAYLQIPDGAGTLRWIPEPIAGVFATGKLDCQRVSARGWTCYGFELYSSLDNVALHASNCNHSNFLHCDADACGGGFAQAGFNSNSITYIGCIVFQVGMTFDAQFAPGQGGTAYYDDALLGGTYINCLVQNATEYAFRTASIASTVLINCYSDGNFLPNPYRSGAIIVGGTDTGSVDDGTSTFIGTRNGNVLLPKQPYDSFGPVSLYATAVKNDGHSMWAYSTAHDNGAYFSTKSDNGPLGEWLVDAYYIGNVAYRYLTAVSGTRAPEGRANLWNVNGQFEGQTRQVYVGTDNSFATSNEVRQGRRSVGDVWRANPTALAGDYTHKQVVTAGTVGNATWTAGNASFVTANSLTGAPGTQISPDGISTFLLTKAGTTGSSAPTWSASTLTGPRAQVWTAATKVLPGDLIRPTSGTNTYLSVQQPVAWTAGLPVAPNQLITPSHATTDVYKLDIPVFVGNTISPDSRYRVGRMVQPSSLTSPYAALCISVTYRGTVYDYEGASGYAGAEPAWNSATLGSTWTTTFASGQSCTFKMVQLVTGATEPIWAQNATLNGLQPQDYAVIDNGPSQFSTPYGALPGAFGWHQVQLQTGAVEPTWDLVAAHTTPDGSGTGAFNWVSQGTFNAASLVPEISGGTAVWTRVDVVPTYALAGPVEDPVQGKEGRAHTRWGAGPIATVTTCIVDSTRNHLATTDATANQIIETYLVPANTAECVDYVVVAKLQSALGSACWKVNAMVERNGSGAAVLNASTVTLIGAYSGLSALVAGSVTVAVSATTGAIDFRATGIAATSIHWEVVRQGVEAS